MSGVFNVQDVMSGVYRLLKTINPLITKRTLWILAAELCLPMFWEKLSVFSTGGFALLRNPSNWINIISCYQNKYRGVPRIVN